MLQVQRDFEELPAGAALSLRDSLVSLLVKHCQVRGTVMRGAVMVRLHSCRIASCGCLPCC